MNRVQACVLVPGPLRTVEEDLRRGIRGLCGENGAAVLNLPAPGAEGSPAGEVQLHVDMAYNGTHDSGEMLALSWGPAPGSDCPGFTGTMLIWDLDAQNSWLGLDGVYTCAGGVPPSAPERAREREAALLIAFEVLRCFESLTHGDAVACCGRVPA